MKAATLKQIKTEWFLDAIARRKEALDNGNKAEFINASINIHGLTSFVPKRLRKFAKL